MPLFRHAARIVLLTVLAALPAFAQQPAAASEPASFFGEILSIVVPLAFIILVLVAVLHLARRRYGASGRDAPLAVVQVLALGPRERIVLLRTRTGRLFAVGVAAHSINLITDLDPAELLADPRTEAEAPDPAGAPKVFGLPLIRRDLFRGRGRGTGARS